MLRKTRLVSVTGNQVDLEVRNKGAAEATFAPPLQLVDARGRTVTAFRMKSGGEAVDAGETRELHFQTTLKRLSDVRRAGDLYIAHEASGWKVRLDPLPSREVLYAK